MNEYFEGKNADFASVRTACQCSTARAVWHGISDGELPRCLGATHAAATERSAVVRADATDTYQCAPATSLYGSPESRAMQQQLCLP